jgi:excisionase family DNA binding protein
MDQRPPQSRRTAQKHSGDLRSVLCDISSRLTRIEQHLVGTKEEPLGSDRKAHLSIRSASMLLSLSESHVRRAILKGELPASNVGSRARPLWRISRSDLDAWLESKKGGISAVPPRPALRDLIDRHLPGLRGRSDSATR